MKIPILILLVLTLTEFSKCQNGTNGTNATTPATNATTPNATTPTTGGTNTIIRDPCNVDMCLICPNSTAITCSKCRSGWYLRTFSGGSKTYNACWSIWKLLLGILGGILTSLLLCYCCLSAYRFGEGKSIIPCRYDNRMVGKTQYYESPRVTQPAIIETPKVIREAPRVVETPRVMRTSYLREPYSEPLRVTSDPYRFSGSRPSTGRRVVRVSKLNNN